MNGVKWFGLFSFLYCIALTAQETSTPSPSPSTEARMGLTQLLFGASSAKDAKEITQRLKEKVAEAPPKERPLYEKLIQTAEGMDDSEDSMKRFLSTQTAVVEALIRLYPNELETQLTLIGSEHAAAGVMENWRGMESQGRMAKRDSEKHARALVSRFPKSARAKALLANIDEHAGRTKAAKASYAACLRLDPQASECENSLKRMEAFDRAPRCKGKNIRSQLAFFLGSETEQPPYVKLLKAGDKTLYVTEAPIWTAKDVNVIEMVSPPNVMMQLNAEGALKFEKATGENVGKLGALVVGDEVLMTPMIRERISGGKLQMDLKETDPSKANLSRLCQKLEK